MNIHNISRNKITSGMFILAKSNGKMQIKQDFKTRFETQYWSTLGPIRTGPYRMELSGSIEKKKESSRPPLLSTCVCLHSSCTLHTRPPPLAAHAHGGSLRTSTSFCSAPLATKAHMSRAASFLPSSSFIFFFLLFCSTACVPVVLRLIQTDCTARYGPVFKTLRSRV